MKKNMLYFTSCFLFYTASLTASERIYVDDSETKLQLEEHVDEVCRGVPTEKFLDDGQREEWRSMLEAAGVVLMRLDTRRLISPDRLASIKTQYTHVVTSFNNRLHQNIKNEECVVSTVIE